jgi:hypothetical protein
MVHHNVILVSSTHRVHHQLNRMALCRDSDRNQFNVTTSAKKRDPAHGCPELYFLTQTVRNFLEASFCVRGVVSSVASQS